MASPGFLRALFYKWRSSYALWGMNSPHSGLPGVLICIYRATKSICTLSLGHIVTLCLSHHDQLRNNAVQILFSMIVSEYHQSEHFDGIENELVTTARFPFQCRTAKETTFSRAFFIGQLRHMFDTSDVDEQLRDQLSNFLDSVDLFLELLLSGSSAA